MFEIELTFDSTTSPPSWLLNSIEISSSTGTFLGIITEEVFEWIDQHTFRAIFTVEAQAPTPPQEHASVVTGFYKDNKELKQLVPSAGTAWPLPESAEVLINGPVILGSLYNHSKTDLVNSENHTQHIFRTPYESEFLIDDLSSLLRFSYQQNTMALTQDVTFKNTEGKITTHTSKDLSYYAGKNMVEKSKNHYSRNIHNSFSTITEIGNLNYVSHNTMTLFSKPGDTTFLSNNKCEIKSSGEVNIHATQEIKIMAENKILITGNGCQIEITPDEINFTAAQITITGQPILTVRSTGPM